MYINVSMFASYLLLRALVQVFFHSKNSSSSQYLSNRNFAITTAFFDPSSCSFTFSLKKAMHFLQLLPLASLVLAVSNTNANIKRQSSCTSQSSSIQDYHTCTNCTYPGATEETTSLVFEFTDPNFDPPVTATCDLSLLPGSSLIDFNYTPCGSGVAFYYDGADLNVERTGVVCGK